MGAVTGDEEIRSDLETHQQEVQESLVANLDGARSHVLRW